MPANAGIQVRFQFKFKNRLDSGFRRNDSNSQLPVDQFRTCRLGAAVVRSCPIPQCQGQRWNLPPRKSHIIDTVVAYRVVDITIGDRDTRQPTPKNQEICS
jgi:hypothetical protein